MKSAPKTTPAKSNTLPTKSVNQQVQQSTAQSTVQLEKDNDNPSKQLEKELQGKQLLEDVLNKTTAQYAAEEKAREEEENFARKYPAIADLLDPNAVEKKARKKEEQHDHGYPVPDDMWNSAVKLAHKQVLEEGINLTSANNAEEGKEKEKMNPIAAVPDELKGRTASADEHVRIEEVLTKKPNPGLYGSPSPAVGEPSESLHLKDGAKVVFVAQDKRAQVKVQSKEDSMIASRNFADCLGVAYRGTGTNGEVIVGIAHFSSDGTQVPKVKRLLKAMGKVKSVLHWEVVFSSTSLTDINEVQPSKKGEGSSKQTGLEELMAEKPGNVNVSVTPKKTKDYKTIYATKEGIFEETWNGRGNQKQKGEVNFYPFPDHPIATADQRDKLEAGKVSGQNMPPSRLAPSMWPHAAEGVQYPGMEGLNLNKPKADFFLSKGKIAVVPHDSYGAFGIVTDHNRQGPRLFQDGKRTQESEHVNERHLANQLGADYDELYPKARTIMIPREMALFKTMLARKQWQEVEKYIKSGRPIPDEVRLRSGPDAAIMRMLMAREATQSYHIPVEAIIAAAHEQFAQMSPAQQSKFATNLPPEPEQSLPKANFKKKGTWDTVKVAKPEEPLTIPSLLPEPTHVPTAAFQEHAGYGQPLIPVSKYKAPPLAVADPTAAQAKPQKTKANARKPGGSGKAAEPIPVTPAVKPVEPIVNIVPAEGPRKGTPGQQEPHESVKPALPAAQPKALPASDDVKADQLEDKKKATKGKFGGDASFDLEGNRLSGSVTASWHTHPVTVPKLNAKVSGGVIATGNLTMEPRVDNGRMPTPTDLKDACGGLGEQFFEREHNPGMAVESIEFGHGKEIVAGGSTLNRQASASVGYGVTINCRGGLKFHGVANLISVSTGASVPFDVSILSVTCSETIPVYTLKHDTIWKDFKVNGSLNLEFTFTVTPDKTQLLAELMKKYILRTSVGTAFRAGSEIMASGPAMAGMLGGYITIKSMLASLEDIDEMRGVKSAAERAVQGYAGGFSAAMGGKDVRGNHIYHAQGAADGAGALQGCVQAMLQAPENTLTADEARSKIRSLYAADPDRVYGVIYASVQNEINETFIQAWKDKLTIAQKLLTKTDTNELLIRASMGQKMKQGIDEFSPPTNEEEPTSVPTEEEMKTQEMAYQAKLPALQTFKIMEGTQLKEIEDKVDDRSEAIDNINKINEVHKMQVNMDELVYELSKISNRLGKGVTEIEALRPDKSRRYALNMKVTGGYGFGLPGKDAPGPKTEKKAPVVRASADPLGDSRKEADKLQASQAAAIRSRLMPSKDKAYGSGNRLFAWIQHEHKPTAIDAHNRGMEKLHSGASYEARLPKNATNDDYNAYGAVAEIDYTEASSIFQEGLALYPSGWPAKVN